MASHFNQCEFVIIYFDQNGSMYLIQKFYFSERDECWAGVFGFRFDSGSGLAYTQHLQIWISSVSNFHKVPVSLKHFTIMVFYRCKAKVRHATKWIVTFLSNSNHVTTRWSLQRKSGDKRWALVWYGHRFGLITFRYHLKLKHVGFIHRKPNF